MALLHLVIQVPQLSKPDYSSPGLCLETVEAQHRRASICRRHLSSFFGGTSSPASDVSLLGWSHLRFCIVASQVVSTAGVESSPLRARWHNFQVPAFMFSRTARQESPPVVCCGCSSLQLLPNVWSHCLAGVISGYLLCPFIALLQLTPRCSLLGWSHLRFTPLWSALE